MDITEKTQLCEPIPEIVGANLKKIRKMLKWTQVDMATLLGYRHTYYNTIENGKAESASNKYTVMKMAQKLGVRYSWLAAGIGPMYNNDINADSVDSASEHIGSFIVDADPVSFQLEHSPRRDKDYTEYMAKKLIKAYEDKETDRLKKESEKAPERTALIEIINLLPKLTANEKIALRALLDDEP